MVGSKTFAVFVAGEWVQREYRLECGRTQYAFSSQKLHVLVRMS